MTVVSPDSSSQTDSRYADWKAPARHGDILIWPEPATILKDAEQNGRYLSHSNAFIQNTPLRELRAAQRKWLGFSEDSVIFGTGHQTELYHAGVWVKDALIHAAANKAKGVAIHFAVDTDQPKHLNVRWPGESLPLCDDPSTTTAEWSGQLALPTPAHISELKEHYNKAAQYWTFEPLLPDFLDIMQRLALDQIGLSAGITRAQHAIDWSLGLRQHTMLVSPILGSQPYLVFVHHILARADDFAIDYNAALARYRKREGIKSVMRPMPDLAVGADDVEAPFWLDNLEDGTRVRAHVKKRNGHWQLEVGHATFVFDRNEHGWLAGERLVCWLRDRHLRLSPRALTLTTFLRLFVVDQFVHGIGGGRYDQVADDLIENHFKLPAPKFAVTTATLLFQSAVGRTRVCLSCLDQEGHRLKHSLLGDRKQQILAQIAKHPRKSLERSLAFHDMHSALATAQVNNNLLTNWEERRKDAEQRDREDAVIFDRELFYVLHSRAVLSEMVNRYLAAF